MRQKLVGLALVVLVATAGCSALGGGDDGDASDGGVVEVENSVTGETAAYTVRAPVDGAADAEWESLSVEYPRENFTVDSAQHDELELGVDTDSDGEVERELDETHISGVNNNDYSFTVELDTDYTLESDDELHVTYPRVSNPSEAGNYTVAVTVNDAETTNATVAIGE